jgi:cysteinyl-tRNA synthetase
MVSRKMMLMMLLLICIAQVNVAQDDRPTLDEVTHWLYLIDINLEQDMVAQITDSTYDMVVIDFITSEVNNTDYPLAEVIAEWQSAAHPKLVIAYIDIGQAESYRTYWQPDWQLGEPEWIVADDPDGWVENYPVAFWYDDYQAIWVEPGGYLQQIAEAGFDGVYLDWVEAYDDDAVIAFAETEGLDPIQEMLWWVEDIAASLRSYRPDALVIAQNAADLAVYDDYVAVIDAIAQEQVWFDGAADNDPPGDCPLPRTEADIDSDDYIDSLSSGCRNQWETYTESTLHVSSEWYLDALSIAQDQGLVIFTVDYALEPENVAWVIAESRRYGFVPFVGSRALDMYVPPLP